jgi:photosystem II stability/assembly factor-like uncharacterized protein
MEKSSAPGQGSSRLLKKVAGFVLLLALIALLIPTLMLARRQLVSRAPQASPSPAASTLQPASAPAGAPPSVTLGWTQLRVFDGRINTLLINIPVTTPVLYAGTDGGVFKSKDRGKTWIPCNEGLSSRLVRALAIDPDNPNRLYAGTWNGKVFVSTDAGTSWHDRSLGLQPYEIRGLAVHTHDPRKLYAAIPQGVFTTTDGGLHWQEAGHLTGTLTCLVMDPERPDVLYVGTSDQGVFRSTNGGASWSPLHTDFREVSALVMVPRTPSVIYAISNGKVYRTETGGQFWTYADYWLDTAVACSLAVNPKDPREVYVGLEDGLYKSKDARQSWTYSDTGLRQPGCKTEVQVIAVDPLETKSVYACSGNRLFVSTDAGGTWALRSSIQAENTASILALQGDPKDGDVFYASVEGAGLYRSEDRGEHWQHVGETLSLPLPWITAIEVDPINSQVVYLAAYTVLHDIPRGAVAKIINGWPGQLSFAPVTDAVISVLAIDPEEPQRIYAGTEGKGIFRSDDGGATWSPKGGNIGRTIQRIAIDTRESETKVYALAEGSVFVSQDDGENWDHLFSQVADVVPSINDVAEPVLITLPNMTTVQGLDQNRAVLIQSDSVAQGARLTALTRSPALPQMLYVLAKRQGVYCRTGPEEKWTLLGPGLEGLDLRALALSVDDPNLVLVGTDQGVYRYQGAPK